MTAGRRTTVPLRRGAAAVAVVLALCGQHRVAAADPAPGLVGYTVGQHTISGTSWNRLGTWRVDYQRLAGGDQAIADAINGTIDDQAGGIVAATDHSATDRTPWTFSATGTLSFLPIAVSALIVGTYEADLPGMPFRSVSTRVFDLRSGAQITWDNLFTDKAAGLQRLSEQTKAVLPTVYSPPGGESWTFGPEAAANDVNFQAWIPTTRGIELHFGDFQFGRGLPVITVPWARLADLIDPVFGPLTTP